MFMPIMVIVGIVAILVAMRVLFGPGLGWGDRRARLEEEDTALRILRERYARGELSEDDFLDKKAMLEVRLRDRLR